jgi:hypothetical protein
MTARAAVQELLEEDPILSGIGVAAIYGANSVDTPPEDLFMTVHWDERTQSFKQHGPETLVIWVHDRQRDFGRIDAAIERLILILEDAVHLPGTDGTLTQARWTGTSRDLFDDGYNTVTKNVSFAALSR